jgi:hypothetical protein
MIKNISVGGGRGERGDGQVEVVAVAAMRERKG